MRTATHLVQIPAACLPDIGGRRLWRYEGRSIALFNVAGRLYAIDDRCPHAGASLANGILEGATVQCRAHGLRFDLATGCMRNAKDFGVRSYPIELIDDLPFIDLTDPAPALTDVAC